MSRFVVGIVAALVFVAGAWLYLSGPSGEALSPEGPAKLVVAGGDRVVLDPTSWDDPAMLEACHPVLSRLEALMGKDDFEAYGEKLRPDEQGRGGVDPVALKRLCEASVDADDATLQARAQALMAGTPPASIQ